MFLLTAHFFKVYRGCTSPCNVPVVNIGMYGRMIMTKANVYLYRELPYTTAQFF